jgi:hypothetical protein
MSGEVEYFLFRHQPGVCRACGAKGPTYPGDEFYFVHVEPRLIGAPPVPPKLCNRCAGAEEDLAEAMQRIVDLLMTKKKRQPLPAVVIEQIYRIALQARDRNRDRLFEQGPFIKPHVRRVWPWNSIKPPPKRPGVRS